MMEALLEHGIVPHALVGTSVGALNAAFLGWRTDRARVQELARSGCGCSTQDIFPGREPDPRRPPAAPAALPVLSRRPVPPPRRLDPRGTTRGPAYAGPHRHHSAGRQHRRLPPPRRPPPAAPRLGGGAGRLRPGGAAGELRPPRPARRRRGLRPRADQRAPPTLRPPGSSSSTPAFPPATAAGARRSTSWSPASVWRCGSGLTPTSDRGRGAPDDHPGPRCQDDRLLLHRRAHRRRPGRRTAPSGGAGRTRAGARASHARDAAPTNPSGDRIDHAS